MCGWQGHVFKNPWPSCLNGMGKNEGECGNVVNPGEETWLGLAGVNWPMEE